MVFSGMWWTFNDPQPRDREMEDAAEHIQMLFAATTTQTVSNWFILDLNTLDFRCQRLTFISLSKMFQKSSV